MPRLIVLLLTLASLAILTVQNLSTPFELVILGKITLPAMPFGLLLLAAIGLGAFTTLFLYGLVGLNRPPESKYRPMGRRVPYPDSPGSTTLPPSGPPPGSPYDTPTTSYSSSSAFVTEPVNDPVSPTPSSTPTDTPPTPPASKSTTDTPASSQALSGQATDPPAAKSSFVNPLKSTISEAPNSSGQSSGQSSNRSASGKSSFFSKETFSKKKEEFQNRFLNRAAANTQPGNSRSRPGIGDDWGQARATRNSWAGEEEASSRDPSRTDYGEYGPASDYPDAYADGYSGSYSNDYPADYSPAGYSPADYASGEPASYGPGTYDRDRRYEGQTYDDLDQGWEDFDSYDDPPPQTTESRTDRAGEKRVYPDGLYGYDSEEEGYREDVYDADYRVIVPPSKPLDTPDDGYPERDP